MFRFGCFLFKLLKNLKAFKFKKGENNYMIDKKMLKKNNSNSWQLIILKDALISISLNFLKNLKKKNKDLKKSNGSKKKLFKRYNFSFATSNYTINITWE